MRSNNAARIGPKKEAIMKLRTAGLMVSLSLGLLAASLPDLPGRPDGEILQEI